MAKSPLQRSTTAATLATAGDRRIKCIVATQDVARDGNILVVAGIDLAGFRKSKTVLWNHDPNQPVAQCVDIRVAGTTLQAEVQFPPAGASPKADEVYSLIKAGTINAVSIGWSPLAQEALRDGSGRQIGWKFTKSDLIEFSVVSSPCDVGALITERSAARQQRPTTRAERVARTIAMQREVADLLRRTARFDTTTRAGRVATAERWLAQARNLLRER